MGRNGKQSPARPRIEVRQPASPEEAAAIAAAIEQFMRDTAPAPATGGPVDEPVAARGPLRGHEARRQRPVPLGRRGALGELLDHPGHAALWRRPALRPLALPVLTRAAVVVGIHVQRGQP